MKSFADQPLQVFFDSYRAAQQFENRSVRTVHANGQRLRLYSTFLNKKLDREPLLCDFTPESVQDYAAYLRTKKKWDDNAYVPTKDEHLSPVTVQDHVRALKAFSSWLYKNSYTFANMLGKLALPRAPQILLEPLSDDEIKQLLKSLNTKTDSGARNYAMIMLFLDTGIRASELCGLSLRSVHLDKDSGWIKVLGKGDKERIIYLGRACQQALIHYKNFVREGAVCDAFFLAKGGGKMKPATIQKAMMKIGVRANIPRLHAHLLRHTAATQYLAAGGDAISLQQKLGHTTLAMTSKYVHLASQQLEAIRQRVSPMDTMGLPAMRRRYNKRT